MFDNNIQGLPLEKILKPPIIGITVPERQYLNYFRRND